MKRQTSTLTLIVTTSSEEIIVLEIIVLELLTNGKPYGGRGDAALRSLPRIQSPGAALQSEQ
jgi:hypothetical protein